MGRLNLKAEDSTSEVILNYLEANVSDELANKINNGDKTLSQCFNYIKTEAKKEAVNGCACISDATVFGWAIHFFEEDAIKGESFAKGPVGAVATKTTAPKVTRDLQGWVNNRLIFKSCAKFEDFKKQGETK